jgi:hypothetical protein
MFTAPGFRNVVRKGCFGRRVTECHFKAEGHVAVFVKSHTIPFFVFVFCVGPAVTRRMYCSFSRLIVLYPLYFPLSSPEALHVNRRERPLSAKGGTMGEKCPIKFSHTIATSTVIVRFFCMSQSCDMGPTALLPHRRKAR